MANPNLYPAIVWLGASDEERKAKDPLFNAAIRRKEQLLKRSLTSAEILQTMGEIIEPDASKRRFLSARPPAGPFKLWIP